MRPLIEIFVIALVIYAGWNQPFKQHAAAVLPGMGAQQPAAQPARQNPAPPPQYRVPAQAAPISSSTWMWEEKSMDRARPANARVNSR